MKRLRRRYVVALMMVSLCQGRVWGDEPPKEKKAEKEPAKEWLFDRTLTTGALDSLPAGAGLQYLGVFGSSAFRLAGARPMAGLPADRTSRRASLANHTAEQFIQLGI